MKTSETTKTKRFAPGASVMCMKNSTTSDALTVAMTSATDDVRVSCDAGLDGDRREGEQDDPDEPVAAGPVPWCSAFPASVWAGSWATVDSPVR